MKVEELPQIFRDCCGEDGGRYHLSKPFVMTGHVYATDGRIIVRMPVPTDGLEGGGTTSLPECTPDCMSIWHDKYGKPIDIPEIPPAEMTQAHECDDCDGEGCDECGNTGIVQPREKFRVTAFGKFKLNNRYLRILKTHGAKLRLRDGRKRSHVAAAFVGDGWDGLLMCCNPDSEDEA